MNFENIENIEELKKFIENHDDFFYYRDINGLDYYLLASIDGHLEIMKYLENEHNWNIHVKSNTCYDAYLCASYHGHLEIMKYLENEHNWDIHVKNYYGWDALYYAKRENHKDIIKHLNLKNRKRKFHYISQNKNEKCYICLEEFTTGDKYCKCHNGHIYHEDCFFEMSEDKCCVCRQENIINVIFTY